MKGAPSGGRVVAKRDLLPAKKRNGSSDQKRILKKRRPGRYSGGGPAFSAEEVSPETTNLRPHRPRVFGKSLFLEYLSCAKHMGEKLL